MMPGWTGPLNVSRLLPLSTRTRRTQRRWRSCSSLGVEQRILLQPPAEQRRRACRDDGRSRFLDRLEPQLDLAFDRRRSVHEISRSMACATPKACPAILTRATPSAGLYRNDCRAPLETPSRRDRSPATRLSLRQAAALETPPSTPFDAFCEADYLHRAPQPARCNQRSRGEPPTNRRHVAAGR